MCADVCATSTLLFCRPTLLTFAGKWEGCSRCLASPCATNPRSSLPIAGKSQMPFLRTHFPQPGGWLKWKTKNHVNYHYHYFSGYCSSHSSWRLTFSGCSNLPAQTTLQHPSNFLICSLQLVVSEEQGPQVGLASSSLLHGSWCLAACFLHVDMDVVSTKLGWTMIETTSIKTSCASKENRALLNLSTRLTSLFQLLSQIMMTCGFADSCSVSPILFSVLQLCVAI